ncbi:MAG: T9SS type A sorting domain-containing protein [Salinivirgaceae bacterium]|jgi:uncharacterized repeat protein (TIGR02543 family)|nr:T9SS type A sorting domain-containing protein [Salinivirgaceae bacterium]
MKKIATLLCLLISTIAFSQNFAGGDGTSGNPWQISTPEQLDEVHNYLGSSHTDKYFELINDINLSDYLATGGNGYTQWGASGWLPIGRWTTSFCGNLDGDDYAITGLFINRGSEDHIGLFGVLEDGTITNINLTNVDITGKQFIGGIVGHMFWFGTPSIENSSVSGQISGNTYVGGIAGYLSDAACLVDNCHTDGVISGTSQRVGGIAGENSGVISSSNSSANVTGDNLAGGIVGYNMYGIVQQSYSTGNITGSNSVGGIAGSSYQSQIKNTFSSGDISSTNMHCGGIAGAAYGGIINNSYALGNVTAPTSISGQNIGGILGATGDTTMIKNTYAIGNITGLSSRTGAIAGLNETNATIKDSYWNTVTTTQSNGVEYNVGTVTNVVGLTTAQMQGSNAATNMNILDFATNWETVEASQADATDNGYPILTELDRYVQLQEQGLLATFQLSISASPVAGGTISGDGTYNPGETIPIEATVAEGYAFVEWTGDITNVDNPGNAVANITMPAADVTLTANFEAIDYTLTADINPTEGGNITGNGTYNFDDVANLTATANEGYQFINWTDGGGTEISNQATYDYTMPSEDVTLTANFELIDYNVNVNISPLAAGTITGEGVYNMGDLVSLSVTENTGYEFLNWTDTAHAEVLNENMTNDFTMAASDTIMTANFGLETLHALDFDSVEDYVSIPHSDNFNVGNTVSVEAWIYPTDLSGRFTVFSTRNQNAVGSWQLEVGVGNNDNNIVAVTGINTWVIVSENNIIKENYWQHIAFVRGPASDKLFVNGNEVSLQQQTPYNFADNTSIKTIGVGTNGAAPFQGKIDEVRVWNVARTAEEIKQNFRTNLIGDEAGLAAYYKFDEGVGNYTFDNSQNNNIGTLTGSPVWIPEVFKNLIALTVSEAPEGSTDINSNPTKFTNQGDEIALSTTPIRGFEFTEWTGDIENITTGNVNSDTVTVTMPDHDIALTANCTELDQYMLTLVAQPTDGGTLIGSGNQYVGLDTLLIALADFKYNFVNWTDEEGNIVSTEAEFNYQMPASDITFTANFTQKTTQPLPLIEDFNAQTLPENWFVIDQPDQLTTTTWTFVDSFSNMYLPPPPGSLNGTPFAIIANDGSGAKMNSILYTPLIDVSNIADSTLLLSFEHFYLHIFEGSATVDVWDGNTWQNLSSFNVPVGDWNNPELKTIDITEYANDKLTVRFQYNDPNQYSWIWAIDNVKIEAFSSKAEILDFSLAEQTAPAMIDETTGNIQIEVLYGTDITNLAPSITVSDGASIVPASGAGNDFTNPVTYTVTAEDGITTKLWTATVTTATATAKILYLNTNPFEIGSVTGMGSYETADPVDVNATTETGYEFINWTDDLSNIVSTSANYSFNMPDADLTLTANFELIDYLVNVTVAPTNTGTISGNGTYNMDDAVALTATANEGYTFINWTNSESIVVSENTAYNFTMEAENVDLTANFEAIDYNLTLEATPVEGGTVSGDGLFNIGDMASVSATANEGYQFINWIDSESTVVSENTAYNFTMPAENVDLTANFEAIDYNLSLATTPIEGGNASGGGVYNIGDVASVSATANEGYQFVNWIDEGGTEVSTQAAFDYSMPAADVLLTANFELIEYMVNVTIAPTNGGTITGDGTYNMGDEIALTATANEGYTFINWTDSESTVVSENAAYTFTMPAENVELTANFDDGSFINEYTVGNIDLYPNPAKTSLNIVSETPIVELHIFNNSGELVTKKNVDNTEYELSVSEMPSGMYIIKIFTDKGYFVEKFQVIE